MGTSELAALACAVIWASAIIFFKRAGAAVPAFHLNLFKNTLSSLCFLITLLVLPLVGLGAYCDFGFSSKEIGLLILSGIVGITIADGMLFKALDLLGAGRMAVVDCLYTPFMFLSALVILGTPITWYHLLGGSLVIGAVLVAGLEREEGEKRSDQLKGVWLGAGSMLFMSISIVAVQDCLRPESIFPFTAIRLWASVVAALAWLTVRGKLGELTLFRGSLPWRDLTLGSLLGGFVGMALWNAGFAFSEETNAVAIINQSSVLFIVILATLFLKEKLTLRKALGVALGLTGVVVTVVLQPN